MSMGCGRQFRGGVLAVALTLALAGGETMAATPAEASGELSRRGALGVALGPGEGGPSVVGVTPGSAAAAAGLMPGDVVLTLNGQAVVNQAELVRAASALRAGDAAALQFRRDGETRAGRGTAQARPLEAYERAEAQYGAVAFGGGRLRDIMVRPAGARADAPVVYLVQGYYCGSMEAPTPGHPYRQLIQAFADKGIATYRVEKPGMGDSLGGAHCLQTDFDTELAAFRAGLAALVERHAVAPSRIVILGHSMGGVQAPLLAAEHQGLRGVAAYGTVLRSWHDYMIELFRLQAHFARDEDPVAGEALAEAVRPVLHRIFSEGASLAAIAAANPDHEALLRGALDWDGGDLILGRTAAYWRGVSQQRLVKAWVAAKAPVMAVYGESDFAAIDDRDHRLIADVVNHARPGSARYVMVPRTGHGMTLEGSPDEVRQKARAGTPPVDAPFNPEVAKVIADWISGLPVPQG